MTSAALSYFEFCRSRRNFLQLTNYGLQSREQFKKGIARVADLRPCAIKRRDLGALNSWAVSDL
jgi:hypothetical protein